VSSWVVAVVSKIFDELDVGKTSGLQEAVRADSNFHEDGSLMDERLEFVLIHDVIRDGPCGYPEVSIQPGISERGDEVEIGKIHAKELGTSCRDGAVHEKFCGGVYVSPWYSTRLPPTVQRMR
jgi:hypothetical protein